MMMTAVVVVLMMMIREQFGRYCWLTAGSLKKGVCPLEKDEKKSRADCFGWGLILTEFTTVIELNVEGVYFKLDFQPGIGAK